MTAASESVSGLQAGKCSCIVLRRRPLRSSRGTRHWRDGVGRRKEGGRRIVQGRVCSHVVEAESRSENVDISSHAQ